MVCFFDTPLYLDISSDFYKVPSPLHILTFTKLRKSALTVLVKVFKRLISLTQLWILLIFVLYIVQSVIVHHLIMLSDITVKAKDFSGQASYPVIRSYQNKSSPEASAWMDGQNG